MKNNKLHYKISENLNDALIVKNKGSLFVVLQLCWVLLRIFIFLNFVVGVIKTGQSSGGKTAEIIFL